MKKGIIIWCVIFALLIATLVVYVATGLGFNCKHVYNYSADGERLICKYCGHVVVQVEQEDHQEMGGIPLDTGVPHKHMFENPFLRVFDKCTKCGIFQYQLPKYDWGARVAEVLSVFLIAFAFQYVIRKRKFIHFKWLIVMFMWLEENTHFGNFCPAVLWKKKLN